jgi:hypothetical protein
VVALADERRAVDADELLSEIVRQVPHGRVQILEVAIPRITVGLAAAPLCRYDEASAWPAEPALSRRPRAPDGVRTLLMVAGRFLAGAVRTSAEEIYTSDGPRLLRRPVGMAHAVAATDISQGEADAVCGKHVFVLQDMDWQMVWGVTRCPRCLATVN